MQRETKRADEKPKMRITELEAGGGHELLLSCAEESAGYRGLIAIHSTRLGPAGGGKSVIIGDNRTREREPLLRAHGRFVETLGGRYITAEDVGTSPADMEIVRRETRHVAGLLDRSGDPSPVTAHGVVRAIQASARFRWGSDELKGRRVAVQGLGHVGYN